MPWVTTGNCVSSWTSLKGKGFEHLSNRKAIHGQTGTKLQAIATLSVFQGNTEIDLAMDL